MTNTAATRAVRREIVKNLDGSLTEYDDIPLKRGNLWEGKSFNGPLKRIQDKSHEELGTLLSLCRDLFVQNWKRIRFGPCLQGAVFEITLSRKPKLFSMLDGYLTVGLPHAKDHFHLCIAETRGLGDRKTPPQLSKVRQCARASFFRDLAPGIGSPRSWGVRLWNGNGEQMVSIFLPNPYLNAQLKRQKPDWSKLALWNDLRRRYIGETQSQPIPTATDMPDHG